MDGIIRCSRYAFGPNRLHYCGPDANREIFLYIENGLADPGLESLLSKFETMFPYLKMIAIANKIQDPFDDRVVRAYWIGNDLLDSAGHKNLFSHLHENQTIKKRLNKKTFNLIVDKVYQGAVPHHSFHVLDIWRRTGQINQNQNLETLDSCLIKSGIVVKLDGPFVTVNTENLILKNNKLFLNERPSLKISRPFEANLELENLQLGDIVTYHWGVICEKIDQKQANILKRYTLKHINLANETL